MPKIIITLKAIKQALPNYKGEWPVSNWCLRMYEDENYPADATVHVYDRHEDEPDFIVTNLKEHALWYKRHSSKEKRARIKEKQANTRTATGSTCV